MKTSAFCGALAASVAVLSLSQPVFAQEPDVAAAERADDEARMNAAAKVVQASLDDYRAGNFESWIEHYHPEAVVILTDVYAFTGRAEMRKYYKPVFDEGFPTPEIVESGWTGEAIYVVQNEYFPDGTFIGTTYAEYLVEDGKIVAVFARLT